MLTVNIQQAKTRLSELIEAVARGEEILIAKAGKPAAMLVPVPEKRPIGKPGAMKGEIRIAEDFDAPLPEDIQAAFEGQYCISC